MTLNQQQIAAWLRITFAAGGPIAALIISKTGISTSDYLMYLEVGLAIIPGTIAAALSWYRNREDQQIKVTEGLPSVATIVVKDSANGVVGQLAQSGQHPNIVTETQNELDVLKGTQTS